MMMSDVFRDIKENGHDHFIILGDLNADLVDIHDVQTALNEGMIVDAPCPLCSFKGQGTRANMLC